MLMACFSMPDSRLVSKKRPDVAGVIMMGYFAIVAFIMTKSLVIIEVLLFGLSSPTAQV